jgi:hypothetical protein
MIGISGALASTTVSAPASAATIVNYVTFVAKTTQTFVDPTTPSKEWIHSGSFKFTYDNATYSAELLEIDYRIGSTVFDIHNTAIEYSGGDGSNAVFLIGGIINGIDWVLGNSDDFWFSFKPSINKPYFFAFAEANADTFEPIDVHGLARFDDITMTVTQSVPEPATWAMMILGFGAIGGMMRRKRGTITARHASTI